MKSFLTSEKDEEFFSGFSIVISLADLNDKYTVLESFDINRLNLNNRQEINYLARIILSGTDVEIGRLDVISLNIQILPLFEIRERYNSDEGIITFNEALKEMIKTIGHQAGLTL